LSQVGIVIVSHSPKIGEGIKALIREVIQDVPIKTASGTDSNKIGTSSTKIMEAIVNANKGKGVLIFYDIGSAKLNAELSLEMINLENIEISEAPIVEGAYVAAVESKLGKEIDEIKLVLKKAFNLES